MTRPPSARARKTAVRRRRPLLVVGVGVLLAAGAAATATAVFSARAQTVSDDLTHRLVAAARASGAAEVRQTGYRRGLGRSTQTLTVTVGPRGAPKPLRLQVTNHIQHGPFPGLRGVAQAVVDTELRFEDAQLQARLDRVFAGKTPRLHTVVGLTGDTNTRLDVPGGILSEDGDVFTWQPLGGQFRSTADGLNTVTDVSWPSFTVLSAGGSSSLRGLSLRSRTQRNGDADLLGQGQSTLTIEQLSFGGGQHAALRGVSISAEGQRRGDAFYDALMKYDVAEVTVDGQTLENMKLHLAARHLARGPLNRLTQVLNELQQERAGTGLKGTPALSAAQQRELTAAGLALLQQAPVLSIERLSVGDEGKQVVLSGQVTVPNAVGLRAADLEGFGLEEFEQWAQTLAGRLAMSADLSGSEGALRPLLAAAGVGDGLNTLVEAGYLRRDGERLSMSVRYSGAQVTLNGKALDRF